MKPDLPPKVTRQPASGKHQLRIIGGQWRSRRLPVLDVLGLRPTPDRVRETVFNWLQQSVRGAVCLDLFAGSGALGFEALSRGAAQVVFVEQHAAAAATLKANSTVLKTTQAEIINRDALAYIAGVIQPFDIIFLDPPFHQQWLSRVLPLIQQSRLLNQQGYVYIEHERELILDVSQWDMTVHRELFAGQVRCALLKFTP